LWGRLGRELVPFHEAEGEGSGGNLEKSVGQSDLVDGRRWKPASGAQVATKGIFIENHEGEMNEERYSFLPLIKKSSTSNLARRENIY